MFGPLQTDLFFNCKNYFYFFKKQFFFFDLADHFNNGGNPRFVVSTQNCRPVADNAVFFNNRFNILAGHYRIHMGIKKQGRPVIQNSSQFEMNIALGIGSCPQPQFFKNADYIAPDARLLMRRWTDLHQL